MSFKVPLCNKAISFGFVSQTLCSHPNPSVCPRGSVERHCLVMLTHTFGTLWFGHTLGLCLHQHACTLWPVASPSGRRLPCNRYQSTHFNKGFLTRLCPPQTEPYRERYGRAKLGLLTRSLPTLGAASELARSSAPLATLLRRARCSFE